MVAVFSTFVVLGQGLLRALDYVRNADMTGLIDWVRARMIEDKVRRGSLSTSDSKRTEIHTPRGSSNSNTRKTSQTRNGGLHETYSSER